MKYEFTNDEVFVLSAICGSKSITGIADPFTAMDDNEIESKIHSISTRLESHGVISKVDGHYKACEETQNLMSIITQPETSYVLAGEGDEDNEYVFLKGKKAIHLLNEKFEQCYIESFDSLDEFKNFMRARIDFVKAHTDDIQYMLSFASEMVDKAIAQMKAGRVEDALETMEADVFDKDEIQGMLEGIVFPEKSKTIIQRIYSKKVADEAVFKVCDTPKGTWIIKINTVDDCKTTMVFKATVDDITKILFDF